MDPIRWDSRGLQSIDAKEKKVDKLYDFIKNFKQEDYVEELAELNEKITSTLEIKQVYLEHVLQKHLTSLIDDVKNLCYLECGTFRARTLICSALGNPDLACFGVDNFAMGKEPECRSNIEKSGCKNITLIKSSYQDFFDKKPELDGKKIAIYLYDAAHGKEDQRRGLEMAMPYLADQAVILVDDTDHTTGPEYTATMEFIDAHDEASLLKAWHRTDGFSVGTMAVKIQK